MDALDSLTGPARDLLNRADNLLAESGAPAEHAILPLLRRVRALPGQATDAVIALRPESLAASRAALRGVRPDYAAAVAAITTEVPWDGAGAEAFAARRATLAAHLDGGPESLTGRLDAMLSGLDELAEWMTQGRDALARTLAEILVSAEAVAIVASGLVDGGLPAPTAAAEIGARVLTTIADIHARGEALRQRWAANLAEINFRAPADARVRFDGTTRIGL